MPVSTTSLPNHKIIIFSALSIVLMIIFAYRYQYYSSEKIKPQSQFSEKSFLKNQTVNNRVNDDLKKETINSTNILTKHNNLVEQKDLIKSVNNHNELDQKKLESVIAPAKENFSTYIKESLPIKKNEFQGQAQALQNVFKDQTSHKFSPIHFEFIDKCWVQIKDASENIIIEKIFYSGESYYLPDMAGMTLHAGNAGGIKVHLGQEDGKILGKQGEVLSHLLLDVKTISAYLTHH